MIRADSAVWHPANGRRRYKITPSLIDWPCTTYVETLQLMSRQRQVECLCNQEYMCVVYACVF